MASLFDLGTGQRLFSTSPAAGHPRFSRDGRRPSGAQRDGKVGFWEVGDGRECRPLATQAGHGKAHALQAAGPDGRLVATAMMDGVGFWDLVSGSELGFIPMPGRNGNRVVSEASGALLTLGTAGVS